MQRKTTLFDRSFAVGFFVIVTIMFPVAGSAETPTQRNAAEGKRPVIIIPGILGSELKDIETGNTAWFSLRKKDGEDLRLPVAVNLRQSKDKLIPGDIIRQVNIKLFPDIKVYQGIIDALEKDGAYQEAAWDNPPMNLNDKFFVFPYDWRRDNVETAQYLIEAIEELKRRTGQKDIKFNILAHSMGGLVAKYAAMYGKSDLGNGAPSPNWSGEKHIANIFFFGTPNEGSVEALESLFKGRSSLGGTMKLPFVKYLTPVDIATMPSVFQLLPHVRSTRFFDENLRPLRIDLFDRKIWEKYGWAIYGDKKNMESFSEVEVARFEQYFEIVLRRAKNFHRALDISVDRKSTFGSHYFGSDCKETLDAMVLYKNGEDRWITLTRPDSFKNSKGISIKSDRLKPLMLAPGDGAVTRRSMLAESLQTKLKKALNSDSQLFVCEAHEKIMNNSEIQSKVLVALIKDSSGQVGAQIKP